MEAVLNAMDSEAPVQRMLTMAEQEEKSEKIMNHLRARLQEIQETSLS